MNVLYIANINNLHDFKWISFFAKNLDYKIFIVTELENYNLAHIEGNVDKYKSIGVNVLPPINNFSFSSLFKTVKSIAKLRRYVKDYKIDCVHTLFGAPQPIWLNFLPSKLVLGVTTRGSDVLVQMKEVWTQKSIVNFLLRFLFVQAYKKASFITCTSEFQIEGLKKYVGSELSQIRLVKTGVDVEEIEALATVDKIKTTCDKFVFSARFLADIYNVDYQIEALRHIDKNVLKEYSFLFVEWHLPTDVDVALVKSQLDQIEGLKYDVCKKLSQTQMWATIKSAAVTYMVPKSDGTPNTALECMAAKKPFILGNLPYNKDLFGDVSLVADLSDPKSLAKQIEVAIKDYPKEFIDNGFRNVSELGSRKSQMQKLHNIYQSLRN